MAETLELSLKNKDEALRPEWDSLASWKPPEGVDNQTSEVPNPYAELDTPAMNKELDGVRVSATSEAFAPPADSTTEYTISKTGEYNSTTINTLNPQEAAERERVNAIYEISETTAPSTMNVAETSFAHEATATDSSSIERIEKAPQPLSAEELKSSIDVLGKLSLTAETPDLAIALDQLNAARAESVKNPKVSVAQLLKAAAEQAAKKYRFQGLRGGGGMLDSNNESWRTFEPVGYSSGKDQEAIIANALYEQLQAHPDAVRKALEGGGSQSKDVLLQLAQDVGSGLSFRKAGQTTEIGFTTAVARRAKLL